jgi:hypothetical protein
VAFRLLKWQLINHMEHPLTIPGIAGSVIMWSIQGHTTAQAVSRWLPTVVARVRSRVRSSVICGGQSGAGAGFLQVLRVQFPMKS